MLPPFLSFSYILSKRHRRIIIAARFPSCNTAYIIVIFSQLSISFSLSLSLTLSLTWLRIGYQFCLVDIQERTGGPRSLVRVRQLVVVSTRGVLIGNLQLLHPFYQRARTQNTVAELWRLLWQMCAGLFILFILYKQGS